MKAQVRQGSADAQADAAAQRTQVRPTKRTKPQAQADHTSEEPNSAWTTLWPLLLVVLLTVVALRRWKKAQRPARSFGAATRAFERKSPLHWVLPAFRSAKGSQLIYHPAFGTERSVLDFNQNAGCAIFGHYPPAALEALGAVVEAGAPLRLPLARIAAEDELRALLLRLAAPVLSDGAAGLNSPLPDYECVLGLRTGAEAIDLALSLALMSPRPGGALLSSAQGATAVASISAQSATAPASTPPPRPPPMPPLMLIVLNGSFHGNATRAAFSSSAVFRAHPQAATLCEFDVRYLTPNASAREIEAAFAPHDRGTASCVAIVLEAEQHFAKFSSLSACTAQALCAAATARGVPIIADEIWSGIFRTGHFLGIEAIARKAREVGDVALPSTADSPAPTLIWAADAAPPTPPPRRRRPTRSAAAASLDPSDADEGGLAEEEDASSCDLTKPIRPDIVVLGKGLSAALCKHAVVLCSRSLLQVESVLPMPAAVAQRVAAASAAAFQKADLHLAAFVELGTREPVSSADGGDGGGGGGLRADGKDEATADRMPAPEHAPHLRRDFVVPRPVEPCALCSSLALACLRSVDPRRTLARAAEVAAIMELRGAAAAAWLLPVRGRGFSYELELRAVAILESDGLAAFVCALCWLFLWHRAGVLLLPRPLRSPRRFHAELPLHVTNDELRQLFDALHAAALVAERLNAVLAPIRRLLALAAALGQWRLRRRVTRGGGACAAIPSRLGAGGGPGTTGDRSPRCAMNLLDALPNGGPPDVTPDACAPLPPTVAADLSLNVDGARPARLDRWREVEVAHRRLLEARGLLSAYARAAAELLMMEASPSHRVGGPPLLSAPVKDQWSVSIHETIIRFHPRDASAWVVDCCADRSTSVLGHHHPVALQALRTFVESSAPAMPFGLLFMKPAAQALVHELELVAAAAEAEAAELPRMHDGTPGTPLAAASSEAGSPTVEPRRWTARLMHSAVDANEAAIRLCLIRWQLGGAWAAAPALAAAEPPLPLRPMAWFKQRAAAREEEESAAAAECEAVVAAAQIKAPRSPTDPKTFLSYAQIRALLLAAEVPCTELFGASTVGALQRIASLRALDLDHLAREHADVLATSDSEPCRNPPPGMRSAAECEGDAALARARAAIVAAEAEVASLESARAAAEKLYDVWRGEVASTAASETRLERLHSEIAQLRSELEETISSAPPTAPSAAPSAASSSISSPNRAEDGLNPNARLAEEDGVLHGPTASSSTASSSPVAAAAPAATAPFGIEEPVVPVVLVVEGAEHGQSWLLRGLPTGSVHVHVLPASVYEDVEALPWLLEHFTTPSWAAGAGVAEAGGGAVSSSSLSPSPLYTRTRAPPARRRCAVAALLIEPVSGQTGACLTPSVATALQAACDAYGVPIISDETRAALGRCGPLLCGFALGLHAHVVTVGEALGAGYASVAAVVYDTDAFAAVRAFPSTSTMANDSLGSHMGLAVLAELQRTAADVRLAAERFERAVRGALKGNPAVRAVRGRGLLLGVTFSTAAMAKLRVVTAEGIETAIVGGAPAERAPPAALLLHVYLLRAHSMRSRPSGVDPATLMVELPAVATDESIARVSAALKYVADLLRREAFGVVLACWLMPWLGVHSSTPTHDSLLVLNKAVEPLGGDDGDDDDEMASAHASAQQEAAAKLQAVGRGKADRAMVDDMKNEKAAGEAIPASLRTTSMVVQQLGWEQGSPGPGWIAWTDPRGSPTTAGWGAAYRM